MSFSSSMSCWHCHDAISHEVNSWITEALGEEPLEVSVWAQEDDFTQLLLKLSDRVVVLILSTEEGEISEQDSLTIRESQAATKLNTNSQDARWLRTL